MFDDGATAELKRMYVRPSGRGSGLGHGLLLAVEETEPYEGHGKADHWFTKALH